MSFFMIADRQGLDGERGAVILIFGIVVFWRISTL